MLEYKGYTGQVEFDDEAGLFHGEVIDLRDVVTFQGTSVEELVTAFRDSVDDYLEFCEELVTAFRDSVDDYLEFCEERGEEPDRPFSGRLLLRVSPQLHRQAYTRARQEGKSLNQWISERLEQAG